MAKIRVYELAKELNIKNYKTLLDKMKKMKIAVSSHMSSLEDDVADRIRAEFSGDKESAAEEASAPQPTVIRKRKRKVPEKPPEEEILQDSEEEVDVDATEADSETEAPDAVSEADTELPPATDEEGPEPVEIPPETASDTEPEAVPEKEPETETEPETEADVPETAEVPEAAPETVEKAPPGEKEETEPVIKAEEKSDQSPEPVKAEPSGTELSKKETPEAEAGKKPAPEGADEGEKKKGRTEKKKRKKKKKAQKDMPARIIKPAPKPEETETASAPGNGAAGDQKSASQDAGPSRRKKGRRRDGDGKGEANDKENRWVKKRISFKRKEVIDGAALYGGGRSKKGKKGKGKAPRPQKTQITTPKAIKRRVKVDETIVLSDLAKRMGIKASEMIKKLMMLGVMATVNQTIDFDTASLVASEFGYEVEKASFEEDAILNIDEAGAEDPEKMMERPPVVTIMGHVDHGKTSLLDVIRKTRITEIEAGGITQHIGAYSVSTDGGQITFLDTPGHEAFTAMRARGATVTDIVVLVVAADDGVMPQTVEAINHSKAADVPIIVAINKIDKDGADPDRIHRELADHGIMPESWGGDNIFVQVSAKKNVGIDELLEMILLQAEVLELRANPEKHSRGYVVESKLESGRGPVATVLIQDGTLRTGDPVVCGVHHGKIRAMLNDRGHQVDDAGPSIPVEILGLSGVPNAGDEMVALDEDKNAKQVSEHRLQKQRAVELAKTSRVSLEKLFEKMQMGEVKDLNIIIKADVHGSIEALSDSLVKLSNEEVSIRIKHTATGTVTESDISLAAVSDAIIIGFNIRPTAKIQALATEENVDMRFYNVIYNVIKDVKDAILGMMESKYEERVLGMAEVRQVFHVPKVGAVAGCYVTDGKIQRNQKIRLIRDGVIVHEGSLGSLRRFKDDVKEVQGGYECGIGIENYNDIKMGDVIECFYLEEIKPELA